MLNKIKNSIKVILKVCFFGYISVCILLFLFLFCGAAYMEIKESSDYMESFLFIFGMMSLYSIALTFFFFPGLLAYYLYRKNYKFEGIFFYIIWILIQLFFYFIAFSFPSFDQNRDCYDDGGVWDLNEERCRYDCKKWDEKLGCIPLEGIEKK